MSKPVKNLIADVYRKKFGDLTGAVLIDIRGIDSNSNNSLRATLAQKGIRVSVINNNLAKRAIQGSAIAPISDLLKGPNAMVYGGDSVVAVARELVAIVKQIKTLEFRGAIMDGQLFGAQEVVDQLSKYPTREEAQAQALTLILSPGKKLAATVLGPGARLASIIKTIQDKLEKGETLKAAG